jgi:hypothetical protein
MSTQPTYLTSNQIIEITDYINGFRALHKSQPLAWDFTIASFSQNWSDYLSTNRVFQHSGNQTYGENLAYFRGYGVDVMKLLKMAVDSWYDEVKMYDFSKPGFSQQTGHFTCLIWGNSTTYALGFSIDLDSQTAIITMNTSPPGNVVGEFQTNVLPIIPYTPPPPIVTPPPTPSAPPTPTPVPTPPPITYNKTKINAVIQSMNNIINMIATKRPKYFILLAINGVIHDLMTTVILPISPSLVKELQSILHIIMRGKINRYTMVTLNNIVTNLLQYL